MLSATILFAPCIALAEPKTVLKGRPSFGINEFGFMRDAGPIAPGKAGFAEVVISEIDGKYYWASRENRELKKIVGGNPSGAMITYLALDGSGYIRVVTSASWKENMRTRFPDYDLDYTEHMVQALGSLTYFGKVSK